MKQRHGNRKIRGQPAASGRVHTGSSESGPARRRLWLFRFLAGTLAPVLAFGLVEAALRLAGYGYTTRFFQTVQVAGRKVLVNNDDFVLRFFPPEIARLPRPLMIPVSKPPGVYRIFIFGESAAEGDPDPAYGPARFLEVLLRERFPQRAFEIVNVAITANNSHGILPIARECAALGQGDLWIVYMGNNEMIGPFGAATVFGSQTLPLGLVRASLAFQQTRLGQLMAAGARRLKDRGALASSWGGLEMFVQNHISPSDPRKAKVYRNFEGNLHDILSAGLHSGTRILLNTMAVNLKDCPPLGSSRATSLSADARTNCDRSYDEGVRALDQNDLAQAAKSFEHAAALEPQWAELQYRWGQCLLRLTNFAAAHEHFQRACDDDAMPARADSRINALIRQAARQFAGANLILLDAPSVLAANNATGVCGDETFYEHVHFNLSGSYRLGRAWAEQVAGLLPDTAKKEPVEPWASQPICERRLALTDWNRRNDLSEIMARRHAPPLSGQSNNEAQLASLQSELTLLAGRMDGAGAGQAKQLCLEAIARAPQDTDLHGNFADLLEALGEPKAAAEQWRQVQALLPRYYLGYFQEGRMLERLGELEPARAAFAQTLALRPTMAQAWFELSNVDASQGKLEVALAEVARAQQLQPHRPVFYACQGKLLSRMERHDAAVSSFRQALAVNSNYWDGRIALGNELAGLGRLPEAQTEFEVSVRLRPDSAIAHLDLGAIFARRGQLDAAQTEFEAALRLDPGNSLAQADLAKIQNLKAHVHQN